jgi:hypothetical protein
MAEAVREFTNDQGTNPVLATANAVNIQNVSNLENTGNTKKSSLPKLRDMAIHEAVPRFETLDLSEKPSGLPRRTVRTMTHNLKWFAYLA